MKVFQKGNRKVILRKFDEKIEVSYYMVGILVNTYEMDHIDHNEHQRIIDFIEK
jgi:hypothetical protein